MLKGCPWGHPLIVLEVVDSTQEEAKRLYRKGKLVDGTIIWAREQTSGRGRHGRCWVSPRDMGLWFTVAFKPSLPSSKLQLICLAAGLSLCYVFRDLGLDAWLKWPNDVLVSGKKICGILTEGIFEGDKLEFCLLGIGVNLKDIPGDFNATSVEGEMGHPINPLDLLVKIVFKLCKGIEKLEFNPDLVLSEYGSLCSTIGKTVSFKKDEKIFMGKALGLDPNGGLLLDVNGTIEILYSELVEEVRASEIEG